MIKLKEYKLSNGLTVEIEDKTYRYFGDYFFVELELSAFITLATNMFDSETACAEAQDILKNEKLIYKRALTQRGVYEKDMDAAKENLIKLFEENSLPYLEKPEFPKKFVMGRLKEAKKKIELQRLRDKIGE